MISKTPNPLRLSVLLLLASLAASASAQRFIKTDKQRAIKKIRTEAGEWVDAVQIVFDANTTVYIARQNIDKPNDGVVLVNYGSYNTTLYLAYKTPASCLADHQDLDAAIRASTCNTLHYSREVLAIFYTDQKAHLVSRADISDDGTIQPAVSIKSDPVSFTALAPTLARSLMTLQEVAAKLYPEVAMTPKPEVCTEIQGVRKMDGHLEAPRLLRQPDPDYSAEAREKRFSGETVIGLIIDIDGKPKCIHVVRLLPYGLSRKAVEAVSRYVFEPAKLDGKPVPVELNVSVNFQIDPR
ncbi:MAG: energy transducer TonB [Acidobacteria bacterium]|nr:energy transducer TonB [Acidobacteriota bacterium]